MSISRPLNIFFASPYLPRPDMNAGDLRLFLLLGMLAKTHRVDLCIFRETHSKVTQKERDRLVSTGIRLLPLQQFFCDHITAALSRRKYDLAVFEFFHTAEERAAEFRQYNPKAKVIVDSVDIHFARERDGACFGVGSREEAEKTKARELSVYRDADALILVSTLDQATLRTEGGMPEDQEVVPIITPIRPRASSKRKREVLFVGGFSHAPNQDGILWFAEHIWSRVLEKEPTALLTIVGSNPTMEVQRLGELPGIEVAGYVSDTASYLDRAAIAIAPLRFGAGMKGKVCEAMGSGVPVVTTSVGAQGINAKSGSQLFVADEPEEFARAVIGLLQNEEEAERIGLAGQRHIASLCGPELVEQRLLSFINAMAPSPDPAVPSSQLWVRYAKYRTSQFLRQSKHRLHLAVTRGGA